MSNLNKKLIKYPEDCKQDIRDMLAEGLTPPNIARYLGVSLGVVHYIKNPARFKKSRVKYYEKHKTQLLAWNAIYHKKWYAAQRKKLPTV